jgi:hypothetical protein
VAAKAFDAVMTETSDRLIGPWRQPHQMLHAQVYDKHASIHDDATAQKLGFKGGTIEGPTHFSQFAPRDGTEVLRGTASVGASGIATALEQRLTELKPLTDPVILRDIKLGMTTRRQTVRMAFDQNMGELYPFSLRQKLAVITENSPYYASGDNPWGRPIIPMEMLSVLFQYRSKDDPLPSKGPAVGLFADQEIRLVNGPLFVDQDYALEREVVATSGSRRTESLWQRTRVFDVTTGSPVATMLLNLATIKDSYATYSEEYDRLYSDTAR